ncbi:MAG: phage holin family protein [Euryarchaeota archaeon]|nr:phage holin family protein [Euryarchaeota archaeon]
MAERRRKAREGTQRLVSAAVGAVEGVNEGLEEQRLGPKTEEALEETGRLARGAVEETRRQADSPEGQELRADVRHGAENLRTSAKEASAEVQERYQEAKTMVVQRVDQVQERAQEVGENVKAAAHEVRESAAELRDAAKERTQAVMETGRRAQEAPGIIMTDLKKAVTSYTTGLTKSIGMYLAAGVVGAAGAVVFTVALVRGLNLWLGVPWGGFITAVLYGLGAWGLMAYGKSKREEGEEKAQGHIDHIGEETRYVTRPVREAFGR